MKIDVGSTDVITYFKLIDPTTGEPEIGLVITSLTMNYVRDQAARVGASATALALVTTAHTDNRMIEIDSTNTPGLYRADWPDAAFASGVNRVQLCINGAAIDPAYIEVELNVLAVNLTEMGGVEQSATDLKNFADAGYDPGTNKVQGVVLVDSVTGLTPSRLDVNVSTRSSHSAADIWSVATRSLTTFGTLVADTAAAVWATATKIVTSVTNAVVTDAASRTASKADVSNLDVAVSTRSSHSAASVWAVATRTLTSFGTLVADVWANVTRTITGGTVDTNNDMRGTDGANTVVPDPAGTAATLHGVTDGKVDAMQINVTEILNYESGDWEIVNNQMIFKIAGGAEIDRFNLTKAGVPDSDSPDKRVRV